MPSLVSIALSALPFASLALADAPVYSGTSSGYQNKDYGLYPNQTYQSSNLTSPIFQVNTAAGDKASNNSHVIISPRGTAVGQISPMVIDSSDLSLVWSGPQYGTTFGARVQAFNKTDYITFWRGTVKGSGYGTGSCLMLDSTYAVAYNLTTSNITVGADIHECQLTDNGTALLSAYEPISWDLSSYGIENGWIVDSLFQEIDIATGDLLFSWRASDHFALNASYANPGATGTNKTSAYDFYHINSIEKDDSGNYLVSARHLHHIIYVNGTNGDVIWVLGGKLNQFEDKSEGNATNFSWQHDARWQNTDLTALTLFDNGAADWVKTETETRGLWLNLNYDDMSVSVDHTYLSPERILSVSQGSFQPLSNGNVFMGYGSNAAFIEYTHTGEVVWDVQFGILGNASVQSYRAYKQNWVGYPSWNPSIAATSSNGTDSDSDSDTENNTTTIHLSWNGATEIRTWAVLASDTNKNPSRATDVIKNVTRSGFETTVEVDSSLRFIRAAALNAAGELLGATDVIDVRDGSTTSPTDSVDIGTGDADTNTAGDSTSSSSGGGGGSSSTSSGSAAASAETGAAAVGFRAPGLLSVAGVSLALVWFGL